MRLFSTHPFELDKPARLTIGEQGDGNAVYFECIIFNIEFVGNILTEEGFL